jgi:hypothetical protein
MYDTERKLLFVHIAKTGGSSVVYYYTRGVFPELKDEISEDYIYQNFVKQNFLYDPRAPKVENGEPLYELGPHCHLYEYEEFLNIDEYYKFSIMREPANYCFSNFHEWPQAFKNKNYTDFILSEEFKEKTDPQLIHFNDKSGTYKMDKLFKFERFNEVFEFISTRLNDWNIPYCKSNYRPYTKKALSENPQDIKDIVNKHFQDDYEHWKTL